MTSNRKNKRIIRDHMDRTGLNFLEAKLQLEASGVISKPGGPKLDSSSMEVLDLSPASSRIGLDPLALGATGERKPPLGKIIAVTSAKGGAGKSTVAVTLATYLAQSPMPKTGRSPKVLALDLDVRDGQLGFFTGFWKPTVMRLLRFGISRKEIEETVIHDEGLGIDVILAPRRPRSADELTPELYEELLGELRGIYDYIILDTSVNYLSPLIEKVAYPLADHILLMVENLNSTLYASARWIQEVTGDPRFDGMGIPKDKISIVLTKVQPGDRPELSKKVTANAQEIEIIASIPFESKLFIESSNGTAMERVLEDPAVRAEIKNIAYHIASLSRLIADGDQKD